MTRELVVTDGIRNSGVLEIFGGEGEDELVHDDFTLNPEIGDVTGLAPHAEGYHGTSRTIKMRDRDLIATDDTLLASFTGMSTTVTKMTDPHDGTLSLFITFRYFLTSHGYHTAPWIPHGLYFMNRDGGIMYSWGFQNRDFTLECGWVNHQQYYPWTEPRLVSWFDDWRKVSYRMNEGTVYPC